MATKVLFRCFCVCLNVSHRSPATCTPILFIHIIFISRKLPVHFCAMASSPLGRRRLKGSPPTPVNPKLMLVSRGFSSVLAEDV